jgi:hypothetical protein
MAFIDVNLDDFYTSDLIEELETRTLIKNEIEYLKQVLQDQLISHKKLRSNKDLEVLDTTDFNILQAEAYNVMALNFNKKDPHEIVEFFK